MALTPSMMAELKSAPPPFALPDVTSGKKISLAYFEEKKALLVMFICCHCPYVQHIKHEFTKLGKDYAHSNLGILAISSNDALKYPDDSPKSLAGMAKQLHFRFPFCYDESQAVAKAFKAACTPDFFLYARGKGKSAKKWQLVYRGQLDDSRPGNGKPVNGNDLRAAIDAVLSGKPVSSDQKASVGCNIKWKPGNEPEYF